MSWKFNVFTGTLDQVGTGGGGGGVDSVQAGNGILVDDTDPANPQVSADLTIVVPYTGAVTSLNLGGQSLLLDGGSIDGTDAANSLTLNNAAGATPGDAGGDIDIDAGNGNGSGQGGSVSIASGAAASGGNANGGDIFLDPGAGDGSGTPGHVRIYDPTASFTAILDTSLVTADHTFMFPDKDGTFAMLSDITSGGTVTTVSVVTANGVSGSVANPTTTPAITLTLGAITPTSIGSTTTVTTQSPADNSTKIASTAYVDNAVLGQDFKEAVKYASTTALPTVVYNNGSSGVGATITAVGFGAISLDGNAPSVADRVLIKNQVSTFQNGIYVVTTVGTVAAVFVLTRAADFNQSTDIDTGDSVFVTSGSTQSTTTWAYNGIDAPTLGTTAITFAQTAGQGSFTAGNGISITGTSIAIDTSVTVDKTTAQTLTNKTLTSPTLTTPALGTPSAVVLTNATGLVASTGTTATGTPSSTTFLRGDNTWSTPSGGGSAFPTNIVYSPTLWSSSQFATPNTAGSGSISQDNRRLLMQTGSTSASYAQIWSDWTNIPAGPIWGTNSSIACLFLANIDGATFDEYIGVGDITISGSGITSLTAAHYGFHRHQTSSGGIVLETTSADGTTQESNTVTDFGTQVYGYLAAIYTIGSNIKFYVGGTLVATHTAHLPTGTASAPAKPFMMGLSNVSTTASSQIFIRAFTFTQQIF